MADYDWFDGDKTTQAEKTAAIRRAQGFTPVFGSGTTLGGQHVRIDYYRCRRGCGTLVWDVEEHIKNVCHEFNPVAGSQ